MKTKIITPALSIFKADGALDVDTTVKTYKRLADGGVDGILMFGSCGEFFGVTLEEKKALLKAAQEAVGDRVELMAGTGGMSFRETIELTKYAASIGIKKVLVVSTYYFPANEEDLVSYYGAVADCSDADMYFYDIPECVGYDITPSIVLKVHEGRKNVMGYKDTISSVAHTCDLINTVCDKYPDFEVFNGYETQLPVNVAAGGAGVIGGMSNLVPEFFAKWVKAFNDNDFEKIAEGEKYISYISKIYSINTPFMPTLKRALKIMGVIEEDRCAAPFSKIYEAKTKELVSIMETANIL